MAPRQDPQIADTAGLCRRNALHVVRLAWTTQPQVGFDAAGVRWLDRYINDCRPHLPEEMADEFVHLMGSFYGECLIAQFGGTWAQSAGRLGVRVDAMGFTYPFSAVGRQLECEPGASVAVAFATAVEYLSFAA